VQEVAVINYPNDQPYTRVTEFKHLTGQVHPKTSIVYEYPTAEGDPYYPIPRAENQALYKKYQELADQTPGVHFVGRLGTYKYYNMDQVVAQALKLYRTVDEREELMSRAVGESETMLELPAATPLELPSRAKVKRSRGARAS